MTKSLFRRFKDIEHAWRDALGSDISTPDARRRARAHFNWVDHGILRVWWKNFHPVAEGVYRANQPSPERLAAFRDMGIKTVLNLRGTATHSHYLFEYEACASLGLTLIDRRLYAAALPEREELLDLLDIFKRMERPVVMHCKSGSDRTGFAAVIYLNVCCDVPVKQAMRHLNWRYLHVRRSKNGILDLFFETYLKANAKSGISLPDWINSGYNRAAIERAFERTRSRYLGLWRR